MCAMPALASGLHQPAPRPRIQPGRMPTSGLVTHFQRKSEHLVLGHIHAPVPDSHCEVVDELDSARPANNVRPHSEAAVYRRNLLLERADKVLENGVRRACQGPRSPRPPTMRRSPSEVLTPGPPISKFLDTDDISNAHSSRAQQKPVHSMSSRTVRRTQETDRRVSTAPLLAWPDDEEPPHSNRASGATARPPSEEKALFEKQEEIKKLRDKVAELETRCQSAESETKRFVHVEAAQRQLAQNLQRRLHESEERVKKLLVEKSEATYECVICLQDEASHVVVPCGHLALCETCSSEARTYCPICRQRFNAVIRTYRP